jgi:DegV family protein with EDD domain
MDAATLTPDVIDGTRLADAWRAGIHRLLANAEHLDKINVFPVADGDTGTNLAMTLSAVLAAINREPTPHAGELLTRIADAAIDGSRGNSGAIFAQFFLGMGDRVGTLARLTLAEFAAAMSSGARYAREALTEPREGTILTVAAQLGAELERLAASGRVADLRSLIAGALPPVRVALEATRQQLEELRSANVVDAGAQGFVEIVEGMAAWLDTGDVGVAVWPQHIADEPMATGGAHADHRWCTECIVAGQGIDLRRLREQLAPRGSSLVVAGTQRKARVHIHTNEPEPVFALVARFGAVSAQKADDMIRQEQAAHHARARRVAIVTDSAADIPEAALESLDLHVVPVRLHFGSRSYLDKVSMTHEEFYRELETNPQAPKTSQPPPGDFRRMYEFLTSHYESVVSIALSAQVSGTCAAARTAAERIPGNRVVVVDSGNASLGQGLVAMYAAECAQAGWRGEQIAAAARRVAERTTTLALLLRLDYAVRGGRVPRIFERLARWLRFCGVLRNFPRGRIGVGRILLQRPDLRSRFARLVRARLTPDRRWRVAVGHANAPQEGERLLAEIVQGLANIESSHLTCTGTALGVHGGPGMLVVGFQDYEPPRRAAEVDGA